MRSLLILAGCVAVVGCVSAPTNAPDWYRARAATIENGYPDLHSVPRAVNLTTDPAHWAAVQADLEAARQALAADPRSVWAPAEDPNVFLAEARAEMERTRLAHEH